MRLSGKQIQIIKRAVLKNFGSSGRVFLFGSRVDDSGRGGDIDLLVCADFSDRELLINKLNCIGAIQAGIGERKIDLITCGPETVKTAIIVEAQNTGVEL